MKSQRTNAGRAISAVICTFNRPEMIGAAVRSVMANDHPSFELTVVDQSRDDGTRNALAEFEGDERFHYLHLDRVGLSAAYNAGIAASTADVLAFTDDDCVAPPDWLSSVEAAFERHPDVGLLYGQTLIPPELRDSPDEIPSLVIPAEEMISKSHGFRVAGMGADFAIRRSLLKRMDGFDEVLGGGGPLRSSQDFDFQFRAYRAGATCLMSPDVWVHHYGARTREDWPKTLVAYGIGDGAFYMKHVRCGDLYALRLLVTRLGRMFARELLNPIRRKPSNWPYVKSCLTGIRSSLRYKVDRERRLYKPATSA